MKFRPSDAKTKPPPTRTSRIIGMVTASCARCHRVIGSNASPQQLHPLVRIWSLLVSKNGHNARLQASE